MNNIVKMQDFIKEWCGVSRNPQELYVLQNIANAMYEGHKGCICHTVPKELRKQMEKDNFVFHEEFEDDNRYYIISWGEEIIA